VTAPFGMVATVKGLPSDDPRDPGTVGGPLISERKKTGVETAHPACRAGGGNIVPGGGRPADEPNGFFVEPTPVVGLGSDARFVQEQIDGPVLVVSPHGDDAAVRLANDSAFGLSRSVWSGDRDRAMTMADRLRTGTVGVNGGVWYSPDVPIAEPA
jgi:aldehyde dehydrogenase (NAD+)